MNKYIVGAVVLVIVGFIALGLSFKSIPAGGPISPNLKLGTNTSSTVGSVVKTLFTWSGPQLRSISNVGSGDVYLSATTTSFVAGTGLFVKASSTLVLSGDDLIQGNLYAVTAVGATTTLALFEM